MTRWGAADDAKLTTLWRTPHNGVDYTKLDQKSVKAVHQEHFPTTKYRNFAVLYRNKARAFGVSVTQDGHRKRSATAKAASTGQGVPLEDISDNKEDPFEAVSEEEDIDLEADSEEEEEEAEESDDIMPPKSRTPKKSTPSRKKAASTPGGDTTAEDLSAHMSAMNINNVPMFSMDFKLPFMLSVYNDALDQMVKLEMWVPILPKEFFVPDIIDGKRLRISIRIPDFFTDEAHVIKSNRGVDGFNKNTHEAQSFKDQCEAVHAFYSMQHIIGKPQELGLPFTCEERIVFWEIQAYPNEEGTLTDDLGGVQFHGVLVVVCQKLRTKRKNTGGFRIIDASESMATDGDSGVN